MFGRSTSNFDRLLEKATSQLLLEPDWTSIMMICDSIRQGDTNPKYAVTATKKKFYHSNPHVALYALQVMESCVKNCGVLVHEEIATKAFMEELRDLVKQSTDENIKTKVLELLQTWGMAFRSSPKYRIVTDTLNLMKAEGWKFPPVREAEAMFEADTAPQWAAGEVCHRCRVAFSTFTRQHHCRACGQVFCGKCSAKSCVLPKFGIEREVRVCDSCFDQYGPKEEEGGSPVHEKAKTEKDGSDNLPAEYLASPLSKQPQEPQPKQGKSEAELKEEEELQLVLALSKSEADEKEAAKKKATSDLLAGYTNGITAPAAVKEENREDRREIEQQQPELEKYLDREYWEQQSRGTAKAAMAPQPLVEREQVQVSPPGSEFHRAENEELDDFTMSLRTQLEIFVNRMKSNSSRGRPIATDSSVQTLFMNVMTMHGKLVKYIAEQEEERVMYEGLQDKLNQVKDARAALDALREEEAERKRLELEEAERQRQIQLAAKLEVMRKKKAEYLEYQRQVALQRMADQEREVAKIAEANKAAYMQQQGMYNMYLPYAGGYQPQPGMQPPGQPLQYPGMPQQYQVYQPGMPPQPGMLQQPGMPPQSSMQPGMPTQSNMPPQQPSMAPQTSMGSMPGAVSQPGMAPPQNTMAPMPGMAPQPSMAPHPGMTLQSGLAPLQPGMAPHPGMAPGPGMTPQVGMGPPTSGAPQASQYPGAYPGYYPPPGDSFHMGGMASALPPSSSQQQQQQQQQATSQAAQYPEGTPQPGAPDQSLISFD